LLIKSAVKRLMLHENNLKVIEKSLGWAAGDRQKKCHKNV